MASSRPGTCGRRDERRHTEHREGAITGFTAHFPAQRATSTVRAELRELGNSARREVRCGTAIAPLAAVSVTGPGKKIPKNPGLWGD